ncbi:hypothetical protein EV702DRAFT_1233269 [Suillus placidus]|uniref:Uncharacterized protein n=1 Tax=Suillus placidus TaxID=48579 RepID=A0A9P6ZSV3_9AGAM|nr:hypothetical protein EV702DRAFT_1233269 [Suillus placidus]
MSKTLAGGLRAVIMSTRGIFLLASMSTPVSASPYSPFPIYHQHSCSTSSYSTSNPCSALPALSVASALLPPPPTLRTSQPFPFLHPQALSFHMPYRPVLQRSADDGDLFPDELKEPLSHVDDLLDMPFSWTNHLTTTF